MEIRLYNDELEVKAGPGSRQQAMAFVASCLRVRECEKARRLLIGAFIFLFVTAAITIVFAPHGKEAVAYGCGAGLIILALGTIGVVHFRLKFLGIEVDTRDIPTSGDESPPLCKSNK